MRKRQGPPKGLGRFQEASEAPRMRPKHLGGPWRVVLTQTAITLNPTLLNRVNQAVNQALNQVPNQAGKGDAVTPQPPTPPAP